MEGMLQWLARSFELQDRNHARLLPMEGLRGFAVTLVFLQHYATQALLLMQPGGARRRKRWSSDSSGATCR